MSQCSCVWSKQNLMRQPLDTKPKSNRMKCFDIGFWQWTCFSTDLNMHFSPILLREKNHNCDKHDIPFDSQTLRLSFLPFRSHGFYHFFLRFNFDENVFTARAIVANSGNDGIIIICSQPVFQLTHTPHQHITWPNKLPEPPREKKIRKECEI